MGNTEESIQAYITSLNTDKEHLVENLNTKGVEASGTETFTSLVPKVLNISGGDVNRTAYKVSSLDEMNSLTNVPDGAVCVVTDNFITDATADSQFQIATLPNQVVFDEPFTEFADVRYRAVDESVMLDIMGSLDSNMFSMDGFGDIGGQPVRIRIEYMSEDGGTTYNRISPEEDTIDFGTPIYYEMPEMWNDAIGKFIQINSITFGGIYEYKSNAWVTLDIGIPSKPDYIMSGVSVYTNAGVISGTLTENVLNTFDDSNAEVFKKIQDIYDNMPIIETPSDANNLYANSKMKLIPTKSNGTPLIDTSNTTNAHYMFLGCKSLESIPLLNISNATTTEGMFNGCSSLREIPKLDFSNATNISSMFSSCTSLKSLDLSYLSKTRATNMTGFLFGCSNLIDVNLQGFDTSNTTSLESFFAYCTSLTSLDLSSFDTSKVTDMVAMFNNCTSLTSLDLSNFDTSKVTKIYTMFQNCSSLTYLDISGFTFGEKLNYTDMFDGVPDNCEILVKSDVEKQWITSKFANLTNVKVKEVV